MHRRRFAGFMGTRRWLLLIFLAGVAHASAYALLVPLWLAPDEPGHVEAACLLGQLGRPLTGDDQSIALQRRILASLDQHDFWPLVGAPRPASLPASFAGDPFLARSGRQVGDEPPLYYIVPALICRADLPIETQLRLIRFFGAVLFGLTGVAAAWGTGDGSDPGRRAQRRQDHRAGHVSTTGETSALAPAPLCLLAFPLILVALPMPAFIAGSANNDALAMLTATAVFAAVVRVQRLGWTWQRGVGIVALVALALASKKTNSFLLLWLVLLGLSAAWHAATRRRWRRQALAGAAVGLALACVVIALPANAPAHWRSRGMPGVVALVAPADPIATDAPGGHAVWVADRASRSYERIYQTVTGARVDSLRGRTLRATVWVRSPDHRPVPGRITVRDAGGYSQALFIATDTWQPVAISHTVALTTTHVKLSIAPGAGQTVDEVGRLAVANAALATDTAANLLSNGRFDRPARWGELLVIAPFEERFQQFAPRLRPIHSLTAAALARYGLYGLLTFAGFWGNFGWLQRPLPVWLYGVLAVLCLIAALGIVRLLRQGRAGSWRSWIGRDSLEAWLLAVALALVFVFLPMLGRAWQPQGRYLFPALLPIAGVLLAGLDAWLDFDRHPRRLYLLIAAELAFAALCLGSASAQ